MIQEMDDYGSPVDANDPEWINGNEGGYDPGDGSIMDLIPTRYNHGSEI